MRVAADRLGVSVATVCYQVGYVRRLPKGFVEWLESEEADQFQEILIERRLRKIVSLNGADQILAIAEVLSRCRQKPNGEASHLGLLRLEQVLAEDEAALQEVGSRGGSELQFES